jgi:hypothetical protein
MARAPSHSDFCSRHTRAWRSNSLCLTAGQAIRSCYPSDEFGKANFEAAGNLAQQLSPLDRLRQIPIKDKMISKDQMLMKQDPVDALKISDVLKEMESAHKGERLPVVDNQFAAKYIMHRSMLNAYLAEAAAVGANVTTLTFKDLFTAKPNLLKLFETSFAVVSQSATLAEAKTAMDQAPQCEDVFVTATGKRSDAIVGWVTDNIIQDNLKV